MSFLVYVSLKTIRNREQLDPTKKVVFQAIQMALKAVLSEVQQQQKKCLLNFGQNLPVNLQGAIHKWRRSLVGGEVSKIGQNCWQIVLKKLWILGRGCQKSGKIADIVYGWPLNFDTANCLSFSSHFHCFLVVFGDLVTKILHNSLFTFFTEQGKTGINGTHTWKWKSRNLFVVFW